MSIAATAVREQDEREDGHRDGALPRGRPPGTIRPPARQRGPTQQEITMGKLVVTEFVSLDGIIEDPGGSEGTEQGGWSFRHPAPDSEQLKAEELRDSDVQLLGRVTYEGFAAAWPAMEE